MHTNKFINHEATRGIGICLLFFSFLIDFIHFCKMNYYDPSHVDILVNPFQHEHMSYFWWLLSFVGLLGLLQKIKKISYLLILFFIMGVITYDVYSFFLLDQLMIRGSFAFDIYILELVTVIMAIYLYLIFHREVSLTLCNIILICFIYMFFFIYIYSNLLHPLNGFSFE
ncbi:hypothetical protein AsAng_0026690 [Aureispira anguillae]|uniref:Uncharacterized protein n=1 Tax=Aureispira anguillae TaxID=2864201 RepID=A0A915YF31_9BACT|nr:hypothetical protein AsAng_0026690 [Aureispira anguillae]